MLHSILHHDLHLADALALPLPVPPTNVLIIFIREPVPGRVKTRLAASVGAERACAIYMAMAEHVVRHVQSDGWTTLLYVDDADGAASVESWLGLSPRIQRGVTLGERLATAVAEHASARVVVVGTDAPDVDAAIVAEAFTALDDNHVVLGPAYDGGYYLIGLQCPLPEVFEGIDWSTDRVLLQTVQAAVSAGATITMLSPLRDVDVEEDLRSYVAEKHHTPFGRILESYLGGNSS